MHEQHGLILVDSELNDIVRLAKEVLDAPPSYDGVIPDAADFKEGDLIEWSTIASGKIARINGRVSEVIGETMKVWGKCVATGNYYRDTISIYDKSINRIN
jgi:hypothetical protein